MQRLYHAARQRLLRHWFSQRRRPPAAGRRSSGRDVEAVDVEDEDVVAEREMIKSGAHAQNACAARVGMPWLPIWLVP